MKEFKTKEEYEEASSVLVGCALLVAPFAMLVASIDVVRELKRRHGR